jgi:two-component system response regulator YesN
MVKFIPPFCFAKRGDKFVPTLRWGSSKEGITLAHKKDDIRLSRQKILLVDDDRVFRSEFKDCFEEYDVIEVSNGQEALEILKKPNSIDLVLLDVRMSGMDGIEVLHKIKQMSPDLGIMILTGYGSKDIAVDALKGRADDYIEKPIDIDKTRDVIEKFLQKRKDDMPNAPGINSKIEKVKNFAMKNCNKKVCLSDVANEVCLSSKYLSRIFKQNTGVRFRDYKLTLKINEAKALLKKTGYNIDQISEKLGYQNTESFIRMFKKIAGTTPTKYRRKNKK